jgi:hypothetical protein
MQQEPVTRKTALAQTAPLCGGGSEGGSQALGLAEQRDRAQQYYMTTASPPVIELELPSHVDHSPLLPRDERGYRKMPDCELGSEVASPLPPHSTPFTSSCTIDAS